MGYGKIDSSILGSSLNEADIHIRWIWICFIVSANRKGHVHGTRPSLARKFNVTREQLDEAIQVLESPDPESTTEGHEGRRMISVGQNQWFLVNHELYRNLKDADAVREANRLRQQKRREKEKAVESPPDLTGFAEWWEQLLKNYY